MSFSEKLFYNFSRLFHCSIVKVRCFSTRFFTASANNIISDIFLLVNTFFHFFQVLFFHKAKDLSASTSYILTNESSFVNMFFYFFTFSHITPYHYLNIVTFTHEYSTCKKMEPQSFQSLFHLFTHKAQQTPIFLPDNWWQLCHYLL